MNEDHVFNVIVENTRAIIPQLADYQFRKTDSLRDLGANSVDRSEIVMMTMEQLSLEMPLITIARAENMGELAGLMASYEAA